MLMNNKQEATVAATNDANCIRDNYACDNYEQPAMCSADKLLKIRRNGIICTSAEEDAIRGERKSYGLQIYLGRAPPTARNRSSCI